LTSHRIRKNSQTTLQGEKREETFQERTEEDPSPGWTDEQMSCDQKDPLQSNNTFNEYDRVYE